MPREPPTRVINTGSFAFLPFGSQEVLSLFSSVSLFAHERLLSMRVVLSFHLVYSGVHRGAANKGALLASHGGLPAGGALRMQGAGRGGRRGGTMMHVRSLPSPVRNPLPRRAACLSGGPMQQVLSCCGLTAVQVLRYGPGCHTRCQMSSAVIQQAEHK